MLKLCYKNNDKRTDEYYFDLQSQKVYKICLSTYYAKQNTRGIPFVFISGGILAILLEQVSQRVLLPKNGRMLLLFLVLLGGIIGVIFFHYGEFMEVAKVKKCLRTSNV